jgi:FAD/FMN-containing dehydrogenase
MLMARGSAGMALLPFACARFPETRSDVLVNDIHSQLNPTQVHRVSRIDSIAALRTAMRQARNEGKAISIAGGRHSMGGQQFGTDTVLIDTRPMNRVLNFDHASGLVEVEAGIQWPERQVETCYPQMADFIKLKKHYDPHETFQSDWYRHYRCMFASAG